ncbi:formyltetrahydrofolate deformylase [Modestobacter sp. SYSU DS0657]
MSQMVTLGAPRAAASPMPGTRDVGRLLVQCDDRPGVVAAVSTFLAEHGANIIELGQYSTDPEGGRFFQRTVFHLEGLSAQQERLEAEFAQVAATFELDWSLTRADEPKRVGIMVSRYDHCLLDLLWRVGRGELAMNPIMVVSNHPDLADEVRAFGVPFIHIPVTKDTKAEAEARQLDVLRGNVDLVVMARYMQILSSTFLENVGCPVINIHHSFLPAFMGANPYVQAKSRGVKLIGATAHYATQDLDEGPIIEQDVTRVSHAQTSAELQRRGADVERSVLARAVAWHVEDRVFRHGNATVVL